MTQDNSPPESPSPSWMCGRATLTMVVSKTTISWAARMTNRNTEGVLNRVFKRPGGPAAGPPAGVGRDATVSEEGI